jgi:large subunit ribosomal protein L15
MKLNTLKPAPGSKSTRHRVGRGIGSGWGKTAGRGHKGQKARSGGFHKLGFEGGQMPLHRRLPKRGFTNIFRSEYAVINLDQLEALFEGGTEVTPDVLHGQGLAQGNQKIKVLGRGELSKALTVKAHKFSGAAAQKIQATGGSAESL